MKKTKKNNFFTTFKIDSNDFRKKTSPLRGPLSLRFLLMGLILLLFGFIEPGKIFARQISNKALQQIQALMNEKASRTPVQRKISSQLIHTLKMKRGISIANGIQTLRTGVKIDYKDNTVIDIKADVTSSLLEEIARLGGEIIHSSVRYDAIRAKIPLEQVEAVASLTEVIFIRPAVEAITNKINTSEGDIAHNAESGRNTFGVDGSIAKIGVLSDGVDSLAAIQASGDLSYNVTVLPGQAGSGDEGTAMLEIIHDLAPGAELVFATAFISQANFAENIIQLRNNGCSIIVDDVSYLNESPFQDDLITQAVNDVTADGALYFSSAGNSGNKNDGTSGVWEGDFVDSEIWLTTDDLLHDFGDGITSNQMTADAPQLITLFWSDPLGASTNDYDLYVLDSELTTILAGSNDIQNGIQDPFEAIITNNTDDTGNQIVIVNYLGNAAPRFLHLNTNRGRLAINTDGQIKGHAAAVDAFGVAAVNVAAAGGASFTGGPVNPVENFSSDGPRRVFYFPDGTPITPGNLSSTGGSVRQKPDITAADGVATATPGFNPFFGTSAAAPHAAAIAGLLLDAKPDITPAEIRTALTSTALDIENPGTDRDSGAGIIMADSALQAVIPADPGYLQFSTTAFSVDENGIHAIITLIRTGGSYGAVSVDYATSDGTATAGEDYVAASGTLSWSNIDAAPKTFTVTITDDAVAEGNETISLALSFPTGGATLGSPNTATLSIIDNDTSSLQGDLDGDGDVDASDLAIFSKNFGRTL